MIKAVLFDYGGVLTPGGTSGCVQRIFGQIYGIDPVLINEDYDVLFRARQGKMTTQEFFDEMNRRHPEGERATAEKYLALCDTFVKSEPVYDLAARLRQQGVATGILSNINDIVADELRARGFYDGFSPVILSCEEKLAKPEPEFYQIAVDRLGVSPHEIAFVDDQEKCRPPAEALGMHFILATSPAQIVHDTEEMVRNENGARP